MVELGEAGEEFVEQRRQVEELIVVGGLLAGDDLDFLGFVRVVDRLVVDVEIADFTSEVGFLDVLN